MTFWKKILFLGVCAVSSCWAMKEEKQESGNAYNVFESVKNFRSNNDNFTTLFFNEEKPKIKFSVFGNASEKTPLHNFVFFPGTAWAKDGTEHAKAFCQKLLDSLKKQYPSNKVRIITIETLLAPENDFTAIYDHAKRSLEYVKTLYSGPFSAGGYSSGASLVFRLGIDIKMDFLFLIAPVLNFSDQLSEIEKKSGNFENYEKKDTFMGPKCLEFIRQQVLINEKNLKDGKISPLFSTQKDLEQLQRNKTHIYVARGQWDGVRTQQEALARLLEDYTIPYSEHLFRETTHALSFLGIAKDISQEKRNEIIKKKEIEFSTFAQIFGDFWFGKENHPKIMTSTTGRCSPTENIAPKKLSGSKLPRSLPYLTMEVSLEEELGAMEVPEVFQRVSSCGKENSMRKRSISNPDHPLGIEV